MNTRTESSSSPASQPPPAVWRYTRTAQWLHWSLALLLAGMLALGWTMMALEDEPGRERLFTLHQSLGLIIGLLVLARLIWRVAHPPAPLPSSVPQWQSRLAAATQWLLYACMLLMPVLGYLGATHGEHGVALFGWPLPVWAQPNEARSEQFFEWHGGVAWLLVATASLHALGALKHLLVDRDGVFQRMWFEAPL